MKPRSQLCSISRVLQNPALFKRFLLHIKITFGSGEPRERWDEHHHWRARGALCWGRTGPQGHQNRAGNVIVTSQEDNEGVEPLRAGRVTEVSLPRPGIHGKIRYLRYLRGCRVSAEVSAGSSPSGDICGVTGRAE